VVSYVAYAPPLSVTDDDRRETTTATDVSVQNNTGPYIMCRWASNNNKKYAELSAAYDFQPVVETHPFQLSSFLFLVFAPGIFTTGGG